MPSSSAHCVTRFAPSPTGHLHLGHLYAAHYARDLADARGGKFLLRFEDIDSTRVREKFYQEIIDDLRFANIHWESPPLRQTNRLKAYSKALEALRNMGVLYPCFCTRKDITRELSNLRSAPHGPDGPLYPGICKKLSQQERDKRITQGHIPAWRLNAEKAKELTGPLDFHDAYKGTIEVDHTLLGDLVLARKDIGTSYHIAVVVDDAFQGITDVTRGNDLLESTHLHRILQSLLQLPEPRYHHHGLVHDENGQRLAKRHDALSVKQLRKQGISPKTLLELAVKQLIA